jgi:hypothetical protein
MTFATRASPTRIGQTSSQPTRMLDKPSQEISHDSTRSAGPAPLFARRADRL